MIRSLQPRHARELAAFVGLALVTAGFAWVAHRFAVRGVLVGALVASALGLAMSIYLALRAWPRLPRPNFAYQLTREGAFFVLAVFVVAGTALLSANNLLFLVLACMLATLLLSGLISRLNLAELELQCAVPDHIFAGQDVPVRLLLRNAKSWMPSFSIWLRIDLPYDALPYDAAADAGEPVPEVYFPMLTGKQSCSTLLSLRFPKRGRYHQETFWLRSRFPFGFLMKSVRLRLPREILVYPSVAPSLLLETALPRLSSEWERHRTGFGHELYRIRPYQSGDSSRVVHWKASAHTGELKVREFSAEENRRVEIIFDRAIPSGDGWQDRFEKAVQLCASLVWQLHSRGAALLFRPGELENVYDILRYLALVEAAKDGTALEVQPGGDFQVIFTAAGAAAALPESSYYCFSLETL